MKLIYLITNSALALLLVPRALGGLPDLTPTTLQVPAALTNAPYPALPLNWTITNQGVEDAWGRWDGVYLSTNWPLDASASPFASWYVPGPLKAGQTEQGTNVVFPPLTSSGSYYVVFKTDIYNSIIESNEDNNIMVSPLWFQSVPADLAPVTVQAPSSYEGPPNPYFTLACAVTNQGPGKATGYWIDGVYLSPTATETNDTGCLGLFNASGPVSVGDVYWQTNTFRVPVTNNGTYYLVFKTDVFNHLFEANLSNNVLIVPIRFTMRPADLAPISLQAPASVTAPANPTVTVSWGVTNQGAGTATGTAASWFDAFYLSTNAFVREGIDPVISLSSETGSVEPGGSYWRTNSLRFPVTESGTYYLTFKTDFQNSLVESDFSNNALAIPISFTVQKPDLRAVSFQAPTVVTSTPNPRLTVYWGVTNQGTAAASGYWYDRVYISKDAVLDGGDSPVFFGYEYGPVDRGDSYWRTNLLQIPVTQSGSWYLIFSTDVFNSVNEADTNNNTLIVPITLTIEPPNLAVVALQVPQSVTSTPNPLVPMSWGVTNQGPGAAVGNWYDRVYLSADAQLDSGDTIVFGGAEWGPVPPGGSYWRTNTLPLPVTKSGNYFVIFQANGDSASTLFESDLTDNTKIVPITFNIQPPNLAPLTTRLPNVVTGAPNPSVTLVWGTTNAGPGAATGTTWHDSVYLSTSPVLSGGEPVIVWEYESDTLEPGAVVWQTNTVRLPVTESGGYYLVAQANVDHWLFESDYSDNIAAAPLQVQIEKPDLTPIALQATSPLAAPPYPTVNLVWGVTNQGRAEAYPTWAWYDQVYVSSNATWDATAQAVCSSVEQGPVPPGGTYWRTNSVRLPLTSSGVYYLFLKIDASQNLVESDLSNNTATTSLTFTAQMPDLAPFEIHAPNSFTGPPYPKVTYSWGVTNLGIGPAIPYQSYWFDSVSLSTNPVWNPFDSTFDTAYQFDTLASGKAYWHTNTTRLPVTQSGTYYLHFNADANTAIVEQDYSNNVASVPITFNILPSDLAPVALLAPSAVTGPPYPSVTLVWGITNQGTGAAIGTESWYDGVYLSQTPTRNGASPFVTSHSETGPIAAGTSYWRTNTVRIPAVQSGTYYLLLSADDANQLFESNETNNLMSVPITFTIQPPDLAPVTSSVSNLVTCSPNPTLTIIWGVTNQGSGAAIGRPSWTEVAYFSKNPVLDRWYDPQISYQIESGPVEPGAVSWQTNSVDLPVVESGTNYLIFTVNQDSYNRLNESDYGNNTAVVPIAFNIQKPDLAPLALLMPRTITCPPNPTVSFIWGVTNQGVGPATSRYWSSWSDTLYVSTNAELDGHEKTVGTAYPSGPIPAGATYWVTNSLRVPIVESGTYYFLVQADANRALYESSYSNNVLALPVTFNILPPDLAPVAFQGPTVVTSPPNPKFSLAWGVTNQGIGTAEGYWTDTIYLSTNSTFDANARALSSAFVQGPTPPGGIYQRTNWVSIPVVQSGTYYLIFEANTGNSLFESNFTNNFLVQPVTFTIVPPDLAPIALQAPARISGPPNPGFEIVWGVTNQGPGVIAQDQNWRDDVYFTSDPNLPRWNTTVVASSSEHGPLPAGESYWQAQTIRVPVFQSGTYYLILRIDDDNSLFEFDESNNVAIVPLNIEINPPDLVPLALQTPRVINSAPNPAVQFTWGVTNQGAGPAEGWSDYIYLSRTAVLDSSASVVANRSEPGPAPVGASYWRTLTAQVPVSTSGDYYFIFVADAYNWLAETNYDNNALAVPVRFNISLPDLAPIAFQAPTNVAGGVNPFLTLVWGVTNQGLGEIPATAQGWGDQVYFSTNAVLDTSTATLVGTYFESGPVPTGGTYWRTNRVRVPMTQDGDYYLFFVPNSYAYQRLAESDDGNNQAVVQLSFHLAPPDLMPIAFQGPDRTTSACPEVTLVWGVTNQGTGPADGRWLYWSDSVSLSVTNPGSSQYVQFWSLPQANRIGAGEFYWSTNTLQLPITESGSYSLTLKVDAYDELGEIVRSNNSATILLSANVVPADVVPVFLSAQGLTEGALNRSATVVWGVTNQGGSPTPYNFYPSWIDRLYLSSNAFLDASAIYLGQWVQPGSIPAGGSYWNTNTVHLPAVTNGNYYLILWVDAYNSLHQSDTSKLVSAAPVRVEVLPPPDLAPAVFLAPTILTCAPNPSVTFIWGVTNQGAGPAESESHWFDALYLSSFSALDGTESYIGAYEGTNRLAAQGIYWRTNNAQVSVNASGSYYFIFKTAHYSGIPEADYGNNTVVWPITFSIVRPDLGILALQAPATLTSGPDPTLTFVVGVTNQGAGPALAANDSLYLSATPTWDPSAPRIATCARTNTIPPGGSYWLTNRVGLPVMDGGQYYLLFEADDDNSLGESDLRNNQAVVPIWLNLSLPSDLALLEFQSPKWITGPPNPSVQLVWHVANDGLGPAIGPWSDTVTLVTNFNLNTGVVLGRFVETTSLAAGEDYWRTNTLTLPLSQSGSFYLHLRTDAENGIGELTEGNNETYAPLNFTLTTPDPLWIAGGKLAEDGSFDLEVHGPTGPTYTLQTSTDLLNWARVGEFSCTNSPVWVHAPAASNSLERFYRVVP